MKEDSFQIGDVVQLRSGGPVGTVSGSSKYNNWSIITVLYFNNVDGAFVEFATDERCLKLAGLRPVSAEDGIVRSSFRGKE